MIKPKAESYRHRLLPASYQAVAVLLAPLWSRELQAFWPGYSCVQQGKVVATGKGLSDRHATEL